MLKILMGPNVRILMGQSFVSWTNVHGPVAWAQGLAHGPGPGPMAAPHPPKPSPATARRRRPGGGGPCAQGHGPMPMCPGAKTLANECFDIWVHKYFSIPLFLAYLIFSMSDFICKQYGGKVFTPPSIPQSHFGQKIGFIFLTSKSKFN